MSTENGFFAIYNVETGEILSTVFLPKPDVELNYIDGVNCAHIAGEFYYDRHYVFNSSAQPRPQNPAILQGLRISRAPFNSTIYIDGAAYKCESGYADLEFNHPGTYHITIERFPYLTKEFTIDYQT